MPFRVFRTDKKHRQSSLFGEIFDWLLAGFLMLWPVSMAIEYVVAFNIASSAYDQELRSNVLNIARRLLIEDGRLFADMPAAAVALLQSERGDEVVYQVRDTENHVVAGDAGLPAAEFTPEMEPGTVYFRDELRQGRDLRVGYVYTQVAGLAGAALVQVAETTEKRAQLASRIIGGVLAAQFLLVPLALLFVWFGLSRGIEPLQALIDTIHARRRHELSPLDESDAPDEVKPLIRSINELMARLERGVQTQRRFVADAAHQMRTPLAGLKTQAELALRQRDDLEQLQQTMARLAAGADSASRLVGQLLALARAEAQGPRRIERIDLSALAEEVARDWVPRALERGIDLGFEAARAAARVDGQPLLLRELVSNLVDNAVRYTPAGGRVTVRVRAALAAVLEVEDNGIGIPESERGRVFERFYRVLGTGTEGSGLGLAIVREIAELHLARVALDVPAQGAGTLIRVAFPRPRAQPQPLRPAA